MDDELDNIQNTEAYDENTPKSSYIIKVIGVGGGGGNAVNYMYRQGIKDVTFAICNTDKAALQNSPVEKRVLLGKEITKGLGAGDDPTVGRMAAEESEDQIRELISDGTEMAFITAGMGGGTGTGATPVVAKVAKEAGLLTIGIVTIPFFFEGEKKILKALDGAEEIRKNVDSLLIINNERLTEIYKDLSFCNAFSKADDTLANAARSIANMINVHGYVNVDFNDVKTTLKDSGTAVISTGHGEGERRVTKAIEDALNSPLLKNSDISSSKRLLFFLYFNPNAKKPLNMEEMNEISQFSAKLNHNIGIKWGAAFDDTLGEDVRMTILASGFNITISEGKNGKDGNIVFVSNKNEKELDDQDRQNTEKRLKEEYGTEKMATRQQQMAKALYVVLTPDQYDNDEVISLLESIPAYNRETKVKVEIEQAGKSKPDAESGQLPGNQHHEDDQQSGMIVF